MDRMQRLAETIRSLTDGRFSGYIKINFSQGSIGRVEKFEEIEEASFACMRESGTDPLTPDEQHG